VRPGGASGEARWPDSRSASCLLAAMRFVRESLIALLAFGFGVTVALAAVFASALHRFFVPLLLATRIGAEPPQTPAEPPHARSWWAFWRR